MEEISLELIKQHGLTEEEYQKILDILGRKPSYVELGIFSVMWSEHCSYKSSRLHLKKLPTEGPQVIQGPGENAGVVDIGDGHALVFKMESHNHPSFIEPYQGAATGVGGILRDVFTMGARPVANLNSLRFGDPKHEKTARLLTGVVAGIAGYGNCVGVPTVGGEVFFDESYNGNILVNAMTVGLVKTDKIFKGLAEGVGNPVMYVGSKTGRDGIHGATMASAEFDEDSEEKRPTVQVGDPFIEKLLIEACLEVMQEDVLVGIQDMGAAGLTSSSFEMACRSGSGIRMDLEKVPTREEGITPYEMMLSESQERMLLVAKKGCENRVIEIFQKWDLDAAVVGEVTDDGHMSLYFHGEQVGRLPIDPLVEAAPLYDRPSQKPEFREKLWQDTEDKLLLNCVEPKDYLGTLRQLLTSANLSSKKWVYRQYDHMVGTNTVVKPGSDAAVLRVKGLKQGFAATADCNSRLCYLDPEEGAKQAVAEGARNLVCSGAKPLATTDCLNFGNPEKPEVMWDFKEALKGMGEACLALDVPIIGGNVSFYNETLGSSIFPTPTVGLVGVLEDANHSLDIAFKKSGDLIFLLGEHRAQLGGSEYLKQVFKKTTGRPAAIDLKQEKALQNLVLDLHAKALLASAHDISEGGLAINLCESAFAANLGCEIHFDSKLRPDILLFGEAPSQIVVTVAADKIDEFQSLVKKTSVDFLQIGFVKDTTIKIGPWIEDDLQGLKEIWTRGLEQEVF